MPSGEPQPALEPYQREMLARLYGLEIQRAWGMEVLFAPGSRSYGKTLVADSFKRWYLGSFDDMPYDPRPYKGLTGRQLQDEFARQLASGKVGEPKRGEVWECQVSYDNAYADPLYPATFHTLKLKYDGLMNGKPLWILWPGEQKDALPGPSQVIPVKLITPAEEVKPVPAPYISYNSTSTTLTTNTLTNPTYYPEYNVVYRYDGQSYNPVIAEDPKTKQKMSLEAGPISETDMAWLKRRVAEVSWRPH